MSPKNHKWLVDRSQQAVRYSYYPDTLGLKNFVNPINKMKQFSEYFNDKQTKKGKPFYGAWNINESTGAVENAKSVWIHPFRANQYIYTEVAPFPEVEYEHLKVNDSWIGSINIGYGWDNFIGHSASIYTVVGRADYRKINLNDCWEINAISRHSSLGESCLNYLFHSEYGFVEMKYEFYDRNRIEFYMVEIIDKKLK